MLLEMYLFLEFIALLAFGIAFFRKNEWFWALALILLGVLIFASYNIEQNVSVVNNQTMIGNTVFYQNTIMTKQVIDKGYSYLNMGFFVLALILFFFDLFNNWKENKSAKR